MSKDTVIKIENLSKQYRLGLVSTGTVSHDLNRFWHRICGKEDPYLKVGESNDRSHKGESDYVWALKDINLEVKRGDRIGIIGRNGAGKSTLLKILSQVTGPTTGRVKMKGRVGSLLEVGTGFHPELTGRENIYMNGTILGMKRWEVTTKLDEIVDFAGVERYLDTPVKRYSSGMTVRLGFAVAAHLEPDILIVDEVLAVGDAEFQKKAIGKMKDVSEDEGRTILFVSHNMASIRKLCTNSIVIENGQVIKRGSVSEVIEYYIYGNVKNNKDNSAVFSSDIDPKYKAGITLIQTIDTEGNTFNVFKYSDAIRILVELSIEKELFKSYFSIGIININKEIVLLARDLESEYSDYTLKKRGKYMYQIEIPSRALAPGEYTITSNLVCGINSIQSYKDACSFTIVDNSSYRAAKGFGWPNSYGTIPTWKLLDIKDIE